MHDPEEGVIQLHKRNYEDVIAASQEHTDPSHKRQQASRRQQKQHDSRPVSAVPFADNDKLLWNDQNVYHESSFVTFDKSAPVVNKTTLDFPPQYIRQHMSKTNQQKQKQSESTKLSTNDIHQKDLAKDQGHKILRNLSNLPTHNINDMSKHHGKNHQHNPMQYVAVGELRTLRNSIGSSMDPMALEDNVFVNLPNKIPGSSSDAELQEGQKLLESEYQLHLHTQYQKRYELCQYHNNQRQRKLVEKKEDYGNHDQKSSVFRGRFLKRPDRCWPEKHYFDPSPWDFEFVDKDDDDVDDELEDEAWEFDDDYEIWECCEGDDGDGYVEGK
ncbi:hypothetical protein HDU76_009082 [Blyttiomyces sp. JEL0837]|nr:hypothetical protein HDU76_009082 [Blyttiomyces sp. JEL0837]